MNRRQFIGGLAAMALVRPEHCAAAPFPIHFRKAGPYESLAQYIAPGTDDFAGEKTAMDIAARLRRLTETQSLSLAPGFTGSSPSPVRYRPVAADVFEAEFGPSTDSFEAGMRKWLGLLGAVRDARYFVLPGDIVRYEIESANATGIEYRVGTWKQTWRDGRLEQFRPLSETLVKSQRPFFRDMTTEMFGADDSFRQQMLRGIPYWRARLDSASGIGIFCNNGGGPGGIDNDGGGG